MVAWIWTPNAEAATPYVSALPVASENPPPAEASRLLGAIPLTQIASQVGVSRGTLYAHMDAIRGGTGVRPGITWYPQAGRAR